MLKTHLILAGGIWAGEGDDAINEEEVVAENSRAPSRARRSSLENDRFAGGGSWALQAGTLTRLPPFVRPPRLTMPFGDDGMALTMMVWNQSLVAAVAMGMERRQWGPMVKWVEGEGLCEARRHRAVETVVAGKV